MHREDNLIHIDDTLHTDYHFYKIHHYIPTHISLLVLHHLDFHIRLLKQDYQMVRQSIQENVPPVYLAVFHKNNQEQDLYSLILCW